jgi:hypothetical protein
MKLSQLILAFSTASVAWELVEAQDGKQAIQQCAEEYYTLHLMKTMPVAFLAVPDCLGSNCMACPVFRFTGGKKTPKTADPASLPETDLDDEGYGPYDLTSLLTTYKGASVDVPENLQNDYIQPDLINWAVALGINMDDVLNQLRDSQSAGNAPTKGWTKMYIPYNPDNGLYPDEYGDFKPYSAQDPLRQHLHLYQAASDEPTPVFIYAHAENSDAAMMPDPAAIAGNGFSIISWETVNGVKMGPTETQACNDDFQLVWNWLMDNAYEYNLQTDFVVIGGNSLGTVCSWQLSHSNREEIKALYMVDAIPDMFWKGGAGATWTNAVTANSPPLNMVYNSDCQYEDISNCNPVPDTGHNPMYGQAIADAYAGAGIGSLVKINTGLASQDVGMWALFPRFVAALAGNQEKVAKMKLRAGGASPEDGNQ